VQFSVRLPGLSHFPPLTHDWELGIQPADILTMVRKIDDLGFGSIAFPDHMVVPRDQVEIMGSFYPHALTAMAFVAGATSRLLVDSYVVVLPYHHPVSLAKAVSTLDLLSGGRVRLSIGVGHAKREFAALGVPFEDRGALTDEYLAAMVTLWTEDWPAFHGAHVRFDEVAFEPKPVQQPHPPIWVGGNTKAAMRRAARYDGWVPWLVTVEELPGCLAYLRDTGEFGQRDPARPFDIAMPVSKPNVAEDDHRPLDGSVGRPRETTNTQEVVDAVGRLQEAGVTWTSVPLPSASLQDFLEALDWMAEEVMPRFR
jgi:probable F420-dependent oxidoreductase